MPGGSPAGNDGVTPELLLASLVFFEQLAHPDVLQCPCRESQAFGLTRRGRTEGIGRRFNAA